MKPKKLEVTNFLGLKNLSLEFPEQGVFVITGPNGSGKSSILEAMYFALYGKTMRLPGDVKNTAVINRNAQHSSDNPARAVVSFTFVQQGKEYLVRRELVRGAHKKDDVSHNAWLYDLSGHAGLVPETGVVKVNNKVEDILGLTPEVFAATVFLGQGKITELVEAKPDKRRKIFDAILETDHLVKMQELVRGDLRELQTKVKDLLERKEILEQGPSAKDLEKELQDVEENMKQVIERVQVFEQAAKELEEVQRIKADMENTEADIAALRSEIEELKEAAERDTKIRLIKELRSKYAELEQWQIQLEELTKNKDKPEKDLSNLSERINELKLRVVQIEGQLNSLEDDVHLSKEKEILAQSLEDLKALRSYLEEAWNAIVQCRLTSEEVLQLVLEERKLKSEINKLEHFVEVVSSSDGLINSYFSAKQNMEKVEKEKQEVEKELFILEQSQATLKERISILSQDYPNLEQDFLVSRLAEPLHVGDTCPVCGSEITKLREIPLPEDVLMEFSQLEMERYHLEQQQRIINERKAKLDKEEIELREVIKECESRLDLAVLEKMGSAKSFDAFQMWLSAQCEALLERNQRVSQLEEQIQSKRDRLKSTYCSTLKRLCNQKEIKEALLKGSVEEQLSQADQGIAEMERRKKELEAFSQQVREQRQDLMLALAETNVELRKTQEREEDIRNTLQETIHRMKQLSGQVSTLLSELKEELSRAHISYEDYELLKSEQESGAADQLRALKGKLDVLEKRLEEQRKKYLSLLENRDVASEELPVQLEQAKSEYEVLLGERGRLQASIEQALQKEAELNQVEVQLDALEKELNILSRLSDDLKADRFPDFYRGEMMNEIVSSASSLLWEMSGGQFNLTFDSDSFRFDVVFDDGLSSDISSLSGGEKVLVALSLAFAISQHFAGSLESIFLDEGLAWLDKENNTKLAQYLQNLEDGAILVGIVTHSEEFAINFQRRLYVNGGKAQWL